MKNSTCVDVPSFGIGQWLEPLEYLADELPVFCDRLGINGGHKEHFVQTALASAKAGVRLLSQEVMLAGMVGPLPEARAFWNLTGDTLLDTGSEVTGIEHLKTAMHYQQQGWNVVVVQNHRSGADMLVMETLIRRHFGEDICADWAYMAGHAVNLYLIPLMFSAAMRRFQIFSVKYQSTGITGMDVERMKQQNHRALLALRRHTAPGGKVVVYYPEGGRGNGTMKAGEPRTSCLPRNIAEGGKGLIILPTYVRDTELLHRPARGDNEFNEVFVHMDKGSATLAIGEPVRWDAIRELNAPYFERNRNQWNERICNTLLGLVARLGPPEHAGPHSPSNAATWSLIAPLIHGGVN